MTREVVGRQAKPETPEQAFLYLWENFRNPDQDSSICEFAVDPGLFVRPDPSQQTGMRVDSDLNPYDQWKWLLKWVEDHRKNLEAHIQQGCGWLHDSQTVTALFHAKQQLEAKKPTTTAGDEKETITADCEIAELERRISALTNQVNRLNVMSMINFLEWLLRSPGLRLPKELELLCYFSISQLAESLTQRSPLLKASDIAALDLYEMKHDKETAWKQYSLGALEYMLVVSDERFFDSRLPADVSLTCAAQYYLSFSLDLSPKAEIKSKMPESAQGENWATEFLRKLPKIFIVLDGLLNGIYKLKLESEEKGEERQDSTSWQDQDTVPIQGPTYNVILTSKNILITLLQAFNPDFPEKLSDTNSFSGQICFKLLPSLIQHFSKMHSRLAKQIESCKEQSSGQGVSSRQTEIWLSQYQQKFEKLFCEEVRAVLKDAIQGHEELEEQEEEKRVKGSRLVNFAGLQWIERREEQFKQKTGEFVLDWPNQILEMEENRLRGMLSAEEKALLAAKEKALFPAEEKSESPAAADAESGVNVESTVLKVNKKFCFY